MIGLSFMVFEGYAQSKEAPEGAIVILVKLADDQAQKAKSLKEVETATLFKGNSRTEFLLYLNDGAKISDVKKEIDSLFTGAMVTEQQD